MRQAVLAGSLFLAAAACLFWIGREERPAREDAAGPAPSPVWTIDERAKPWFRLADPGLDLGATSYEVRRRKSGGREDILVFGDARAAGPFVRLVIYRAGTEPIPRSAFFVNLARLAAETGRAVTFAAQPRALTSRLGVFEAADLTLTVGASPPEACIGFRLADAAEASPAMISGFACDGPSSAGARGPARAELACLIDAMELLPDAGDDALAAFFAAREFRTVTECSGLYPGAEANAAGR